MEQPDRPPGRRRRGQIGPKESEWPGRAAGAHSLLQDQRQRDRIGHRHKIRVDRDGQQVQDKEAGEGVPAFPAAPDIVIQRPQHKELRRQRGVAQRTLPQDRAEHEQQVAQKRQGAAFGKQPQQPRAERPLQEKADKREPAEILERFGKKRGEQAEKSRQQRDGIGVSDAEPIRPVDAFGNAQREAQRALAVEQPARIVLLDIFFDKAAAAEGVVGHIQRREPEHEQKSGGAQKPAD